MKNLLLVILLPLFMAGCLGVPGYEPLTDYTQEKIDSTMVFKVQYENSSGDIITFYQMKSRSYFERGRICPEACNKVDMERSEFEFASSEVPFTINYFFHVTEGPHGSVWDKVKVTIDNIKIGKFICSSQMESAYCYIYEVDAEPFKGYESYKYLDSININGRTFYNINTIWDPSINATIKDLYFNINEGVVGFTYPNGEAWVKL